ncbi:TetR/AcrR family transcriptional regulator [Sphingomonas sp.]|uniref:TetR/AcrR family transcriptional regulator n=1 Tax=Sphingomonas sp. TaxID=28214 RepID=UPI003D6CF11D
MAGRSVKVAVETWIDTARRALIEEGVSGVKVDRLATRLGVTRGGFYHNFRDREELLSALLARWDSTCHFLPDEGPGTTPSSAAQWIDHVIARLIEEDGYDHRFDMAVREWSRSDQRAAWAVERADRHRMAVLERFFRVLGYLDEEAVIRARILYFHQIGYYAIGVKNTTAERRRTARIYMDILCGHDAMDAARGKTDGKIRPPRIAALNARANLTT